MNKLFLLAIVFSVVLSLGLVVACGDDDDDDDNDTADDDTTGDDDTGGEMDCAAVYAELYEDCSLALTDTDGNEIAEADAVASCEAGDAAYALTGEIAGCVVAYTGDCTAIEDCITDVLS